ncbi:MAG: hypothetical protein NFCOHLIN_00284 [Gammaproteobacteria bacterium]|nr:hypothetical protein [Gammaproteobacteria bacterium]
MRRAAVSDSLLPLASPYRLSVFNRSWHPTESYLCALATYYFFFFAAFFFVFFAADFFATFFLLAFFFAAMFNPLSMC